MSDISRTVIRQYGGESDRNLEGQIERDGINSRSKIETARNKIGK